MLVVWDLNPSNTSSDDLQGGPTAEHLHHSDDANCVQDHLRVSGAAHLEYSEVEQHSMFIGKTEVCDYLAWSWSSETKAGSATHAVLGGLQV